jgi:DNA-binding NarL/FixJ family response regulator
MDSSGDTLRVLIADGQHFFREGLRGMLEAAGMSVVGETTGGDEAIALANSLEPDVMVVDLNMPDASGTRALRRIAAAHPSIQVIVLAVSAEETGVVEALESGACGYLLKNTGVDELVGAIRQATSGQAVLSHDAMRALVSRVRANSNAKGPPSRLDESTLTAREMDVLRLIVEGADNAAIGLELSISRHTVKQHVTNIFEKLGVRGRGGRVGGALRTRLSPRAQGKALGTLCGCAVGVDRAKRRFAVGNT